MGHQVPRARLRLRPEEEPFRRVRVPRSALRARRLIYIFGFSRGAYTARALTGLLQRVGLVERGCDNLIPYAVRYFQARDDHQLNFFKQRFSRTYHLLWREVVPDIDQIPALKEKANRPSRGVIPVHFLGVWDTVKSIGVLCGSRSRCRTPTGCPT
jgi:uncharacterized protein (DUF2235 family)